MDFVIARIRSVGSGTLWTVLLFSGFGHYAQWGGDGRGGLLRIGS